MDKVKAKNFWEADFRFWEFLDHFGATWSKIGHFVKFAGLAKINSHEMNKIFWVRKSILPRNKWKFSWLAKVNSREKLSSHSFAKVNSRKMQTFREFFGSRKFVPAKVCTIKVTYELRTVQINRPCYSLKIRNNNNKHVSIHWWVSKTSTSLMSWGLYEQSICCNEIVIHEVFIYDNFYSLFPGTR